MSEHDDLVKQLVMIREQLGRMNWLLEHLVADRVPRPRSPSEVRQAWQT